MFKLIVVIFVFQMSSMFSQEHAKDTLFFDLDNKYIKTFEELPSRYYINEKLTEGGFYFLIVEEPKLNTPKEVFSLKNYIQRKKIFKTTRINSNKLYDLLQECTIIFVKQNPNNISFITVKPRFEIE